MAPKKQVLEGMMEKQKSPDVDNNWFSARKEGNIAVLDIKKNLLLRIDDIRAKEDLFEYLRHISGDDAVKVILVIGAPDKMGRDEYIQFYKKMFQAGFNLDNLARLYNATDQLVKRLAYIEKMVVHADSGKIISLFMNISLACDYRVAGDNAVYQNTHHEFGLIPKGGGAFFLTRIAGIHKASEILLREDDIPVAEAFEYGFVDKIVPAEQIQEASMRIARKFAEKSSHTLSGIKGMLNCCLEGLEKCLEYENIELRKIIRSYTLTKSKPHPL